MIKLLSIAKIFLLFSVLNPLMGYSRETKLPIISVSGHACDSNERVSVNIRIEASKNSPAYCFSEASGPNRTIRYPHAYYLYSVTMTDFHASFAQDFDTQERFKARVFEYYPNGVNHNGAIVSPLNYFNHCEFEVKELNVHTQQTNLVIRDSFYNRLENTFKIPQGSTRTADYSFNRAGDRVRLKVFVIKDE